MVFEPNAIEIAMSDLRRVLRAEARHASKMRKRGGANHPSVHTTHAHLRAHYALTASVAGSIKQRSGVCPSDCPEGGCVR